MFEYLRGIEEYRDPIAGGSVELPVGYKNALMYVKIHTLQIGASFAFWSQAFMTTCDNP
jgi:hypothetical protein